MHYKFIYQTPNDFSNIILYSDGEYLTGLVFENSKNCDKYSLDCVEKNLKIFQETTKWLDLYFQGKPTDFTPKYKIEKLTKFQKEVYDLMLNIPFGETTTYNDIAKQIASNKGVRKMSAQAVGGAVGSNPICIIIPCHRVIGSNGNLTGYSGGLKNKLLLLKQEHVPISQHSFPKKRQVQFDMA